MKEVLLLMSSIAMLANCQHCNYSNIFNGRIAGIYSIDGVSDGLDFGKTGENGCVLLVFSCQANKKFNIVIIDNGFCYDSASCCLYDCFSYNNELVCEKNNVKFEPQILNGDIIGLWKKTDKGIIYFSKQH